MLTYRATNIHTGCYYIGSAKTYCHYMNRIGSHHMGSPYNDFRKHLQKSPKDFVWEILCEDDLATRIYEYDLLQKHIGDPLCYNKSSSNGAMPGVSQRGEGWKHSEETRQKIGEGNRNPSAEKRKRQSEGVSRTNSKKQPCPQCGMLMNVGNLAKHIKGTRCKGR